jgi:hypothetical protein
MKKTCFPFTLIIILMLISLLATGCRSGKQASSIETQVAATLDAMITTITAQADLPTATPTPVITTTLFGEWQLQVMTQDGELINPPPDYEIVFKSNGAYESLQDYSPVSGDWQLSLDGFSILLDLGEPHQQTWQIVEMTSNLHIKTTQSGKNTELIFGPLFAPD